MRETYCKTDGKAWKIEGILQAQVELRRKVPKVIQAAIIAPLTTVSRATGSALSGGWERDLPIEYWVFDNAVAVALWPVYPNQLSLTTNPQEHKLGYANSATRTGPIAPTTTPPIPSSKRPVMNIPAT